MNRALGYGLMGAAQGFLTGLGQEWQQNQEDIRSQKLLAAKAQEQMALESLKAQFQSAQNLQKIQAQLEADTQLEGVKSKDQQTLQAQKDESEDARAAANRTSEEKRTGISAGATIQAAQIRSDAESKPKPRGEQIWQTPDGKNVLVQPGETPPEKGNLIWTQGGSVGARIRGGTPGAGSGLNGLFGPPPVTGAAAPASSAAPGSSQNNPIDATSTPTQPPPGTWVRLPSGRVMQIPGA